MDVISSLV